MLPYIACMDPMGYNHPKSPLPSAPSARAVRLQRHLRLAEKRPDLLGDARPSLVQGTEEKHGRILERFLPVIHQAKSPGEHNSNLKDLWIYYGRYMMISIYNHIYIRYRIISTPYGFDKLITGMAPHWFANRRFNRYDDKKCWSSHANRESMGYCCCFCEEK